MECVKRSIHIALVFNIVLVVAILVVSFVGNKARQASWECRTNATNHRQLQDVSAPQTYCFELEETACEERGFKTTYKDNHTVCCGNLAVHLRSLLSEVSFPEKLSSKKLFLAFTRNKYICE